MAQWKRHDKPLDPTFRYSKTSVITATYQSVRSRATRPSWFSNDNKLPLQGTSSSHYLQQCRHMPMVSGLTPKASTNDCKILKLKRPRGCNVNKLWMNRHQWLETIMPAQMKATAFTTLPHLVKTTKTTSLICKVKCKSKVNRGNKWTSRQPKEQKTAD